MGGQQDDKEGLLASSESPPVGPSSAAEGRLAIQSLPTPKTGSEDIRDPYSATERNAISLLPNFSFSSKVHYRPDSVQAALFERNHLWNSLRLTKRRSGTAGKHAHVPFLDDDEVLSGELGDEDENTISLHRRYGSTVGQTTTNLCKSILGAGCFALGAGFKESGIWLGIIGTIGCALLTVYTIRTLVLCKQSLGPVLSNGCSYEDIVRIAFGKWAAYLLQIAIIVTCVGSCAAYVDFVAGMATQAILPNDPNNRLVCIYVILAYGVLEIPLALLRSFKYLAFTSILGNACFAFSVAALFYDAATNGNIGNPTDKSRYHQWEFWTLPSFFGKVAFLFINHFLVFPLEQSMKEPARFQTSVNRSFAISSIISILIGFFGYLMYGNGVSDLIVNNMEKGVLVDLVKAALIFELVFTFPVIMAAGREIVEKWLVGDDAEKKPGANVTWVTWKRNLVRILLVVLACGFAACVPNFSDVVNIISGLASCLMGFIFPPLLYLKICRPTLGCFTQILQVVIALAGVLLAVVTTYAGIAALF